MNEQFDKFINGTILFLLSGVTFISPIHTLLLLIIPSVMFDLFTGYLSSLKTNNIKGFRNTIRHFSSNKATKSVVKMILYLMFTIFIFIFEYALIGNSVYIVKMSTFLIVFIELKSICENMDILTGRDVFTTLLRKIRKIFETKLSNKITDK